MAAVRSQKSSNTQLSLSKCALKYALAVSDPLSIQARGSCVPIGTAPTMKTHAYVRFDLTIGTGGYGMALFTPSLANDMASVFYTDNTYPGGAGGRASPFATAGSSATPATYNIGWTSAKHNGPFAANQLVNVDASASLLQGRIVAAGARVQYTGTTLNESGLYYCYHDPSHSSVAGLTQSEIGGYGDTNVEAITRAPCTLNMFAVDESEQVFNTVSVGGISSSTTATAALYPYSGGVNTWLTDSTTNAVVTPYLPVPGGSVANYLFGGVPIGVIMVSGVAGSTVHIEYQLHFEYVGIPAASMLTPVTPDIEGSAIVRTAALALPQRKLANPMGDGWSLFYGAMAEVYKAAKPVLVPAVQTALMAMVL